MENKKNNMDWITCVYSEAWAQYVHEDTLNEERSMKYLTVTTVFMSLFGFMATILAALIPNMDIGKTKDWVFIAMMLFIGSILLISYLRILSTWKYVTDAGREYVNLRFKAILEIEKTCHLNPTIAVQEDIWKKKRSEQEKIKKKKWIGGYKGIQGLIQVYGFIAVIMLVLDIVCLIWLIWRYFPWLP